MLLFFIYAIAVAQKEDSKQTKFEKNIKERSLEVQIKIWASNNKAFDVTTIKNNITYVAS
ncbi:MAG: hypothetical protein HY305_01065 [Sphingobacteriales bacterium]|nr:hypothetical protein [Sphingobacteriales bacterium]